jgi:hypothetical protein
MKTRTLLLSGLASAALLAGMANAQQTETEIETDGDVTTMTVPIEDADGAETDGTAVAEEDAAPEGDDATLAQDEGATATGDEAMTAETDAEADPAATGDEPMTAEGETDPAAADESMTAEGETDPAATQDDSMTAETETFEIETETATETTTDSSGLYGAFAQIPVAVIVGMNVRDGAGESLGDVEQLVSFDGEPNAILGIGGFLGLGQHEVAVPLNRFELTEDGLVLPDATREELEAMQEWDGEAGTEMQTDLTVEEAS